MSPEGQAVCYLIVVVVLLVAAGVAVTIRALYNVLLAAALAVAFFVPLVNAAKTAW